MPLFFFDIEPGDEQPGSEAKTPSKAAEIVARRFHEKIQAMSSGHRHSAEAKEAEQADVEQTETDTTSIKTS